MKSRILKIMSIILATTMCSGLSACRRGAVSSGANQELVDMSLTEYLNSDKCKISDNIKIDFDSAAVDERFGKITAVNIYNATEHFFENDEEIQNALIGKTMPKSDEPNAFGNAYSQGDTTLIINKKDAEVSLSGLVFTENINNHNDKISFIGNETLDGVKIGAGINGERDYRNNVDIEHLGPYTQQVDRLQEIFKKIGMRDDVRLKVCYAVENDVTKQCLEKLYEYEEKNFGQTDTSITDTIENLSEADEGYLIRFVQTVDSIDVNSVPWTTSGNSNETVIEAQIENDYFNLNISRYMDIGDKIETAGIINAADAMNRVFELYKKYPNIKSVQIYDQRLNYQIVKNADGSCIVKPYWIFYVEQQNGNFTEYGHWVIDAATGDFMQSSLSYK